MQYSLEKQHFGEEKDEKKRGRTGVRGVEEVEELEKKNGSSRTEGECEK